MSKEVEKDIGLAVYFLQGLLNENLNPTKVKKHKSFYNNKYKDIAKKYGFKNFISMFDYCMNDQNSLDFIAKSTEVNQGTISNTGNKSKEKDTSDLVLATKTSMRNGKPYTSRYWVDPNTSNNNSDKDSQVTNTNNINIIQDGLYIGGKDFGNPLQTTIQSSNPPKSWIKLGTVKSNCFDYIYTVNNNEIIFISGLLKDNNDIVSIQYVSSVNSKTLLSGIYKLIAKVMKESWLHNYGVSLDSSMFDKYINIVPICDYYQLKKNNNIYKATPKQLQNILGDTSWWHPLS